MHRMNRTLLLILLLVFVLPAVSIGAGDILQDIIQKAQAHVGSGYCRGGTAPPCFDCSGFVGYVMRPYAAGLPRTSRDMARYGTPVNRQELQPGDLVFFTTTSRRDVISHVAIYIGQDSIIHSISDGPDRGVHITSINARYWHSHYYSAGRVLQAEYGTPEAPEAPGTFEPIRYAKGIYTGDLKGGEPNGDGVLRLDNGDRYEGQFLEGLFHGEGTYTWKNGAVYRGEFENGEIHGQGVYTSSSGELQEGRWEKGTYTTYMQEKDSPWDSWDGYIRGDFEAWQQQERESFEQWKKEHSPDF